uniref:Uncharacterized protein n=1 Tax=mine drainage metagenome TaxID=410659 RepID=E6QL30_9ZZZZ
MQRAFMAIPLVVLWLGILGATTFAFGQSAATPANTVLGPAQTAKMLPASVYFKGQSATTQIRNSGGVKFSDGSYTLAVLVDTSGYSSDVQQKYQAYLITESPINIEGKPLPAGIYGVGFEAGNKFVVMDVGAHDLLAVPSQTDAALKRPMPLKVTAADNGTFRLYAGRRFISFSR